MKKHFLLFALLILVTLQLSAQKDTLSRIPLIGEEAPSFIAESTNGTINFPSDYSKNWKILFSHPADFTPVCSSEILELAAMQNDFDKLNVKLLILSTDKLDRHYNWKRTLETLATNGREPVKIKFPLIDDNSREICGMYGMISPKVNATRAVRGVYIISPENKIESINFYPMEIGRNMEEIKRTIYALQAAHSMHVLTPANWHIGDDVMLPYLDRNQQAALEENKGADNFSDDQLGFDVKSIYFDEYQDSGMNRARTDQKNSDIYSLSWFMFYKKSK